jgi:GNAT superfamily N-acetyltransferase
MKHGLISLRDFPTGGLADMLAESYAPLLREVPKVEALRLRRNWSRFDTEVHEAPATVGKCGFVTLIEDQPVGFGSWDPRDGPRLGRVGHNCVRPQHQKKGHGRRQILEILERLREQGFAKVEARTDEHPFFEAARRTYESCGFRAVGRTAGHLTERYETIIYEVVLKS